jgi:hypothetical protein
MQLSPLESFFAGRENCFSLPGKGFP